MAKKEKQFSTKKIMHLILNVENVCPKIISEILNINDFVIKACWALYSVFPSCSGDVIKL